MKRIVIIFKTAFCVVGMRDFGSYKKNISFFKGIPTALYFNDTCALGIIYCLPQFMCVYCNAVCVIKKPSHSIGVQCFLYLL